MAGDLADVVVSALTAGAAAATKDTASVAVKAAYGKLTKALRKRFGPPEADALGKIARASGDTETTRTRLAAALAGSELRPDDALVVRARAMLAETHPSRYVVDVRDAKGVQIGDGNNMTLDFRSND